MRREATRAPRKPISKNAKRRSRVSPRRHSRQRETRGTGISALYPIAGSHATADTPVGRSRSETQVAHYAAVKPDNRSVGGGDSGGGGGGGDGSGGSGGGSNGSGSDSTRTGTDKLDGLPIPLISVPGAENAAGQL